MKCTLPSILSIALLALAGCNQGSSGGPGANASSAEKSTFGQHDETFSLDMPTLSTKINQGESEQIAIGINRGTNMDGDVALAFGELPGGVTVNPLRPTIKREDTEAILTFSAAGDASVGDFTVRITGHPTKGPDATNELKISIAGQDHGEVTGANVENDRIAREQFAMETRRQLDALNVKYEALIQDTANAEGESREILQARLDLATARRDVAEARLQELQEPQETRGDPWEKVKDGVENAFADLKSIFE